MTLSHMQAFVPMDGPFLLSTADHIFEDRVRVIGMVRFMGMVRVIWECLGLYELVGMVMQRGVATSGMSNSPCCQSRP